MMNTTPPLTELQLHDIHLPEAISWWPLAPGWWALLALLVFVVVSLILLYKTRHRRRHNRQLHHEIEQQLDTVKQDYRQGGNAVILTRELSELLRRAGISYYPARDIAGLTGEDWLAFLSQTHAKERPGFSFASDTASILLTAPYLDDEADIDPGVLDSGKLIALCESWLMQSHKNPGNHVPTERNAISVDGRQPVNTI